MASSRSLVLVLAVFSACGSALAARNSGALPLIAPVVQKAEDARLSIALDGDRIRIGETTDQQIDPDDSSVVVSNEAVVMNPDTSTAQPGTEAGAGPLPVSTAQRAEEPRLSIGVDGDRLRIGSSKEEQIDPDDAPITVSNGALVMKLDGAAAQQEPEATDARARAVSAYEHEAAVTAARGGVVLEPAGNADVEANLQILNDDERYLAAQAGGAKPAEIEDPREVAVAQPSPGASGDRELAVSTYEHEAAVAVAQGAVVLEPAASAAAGTLSRTLDEDETYLASQTGGAKPAGTEDSREIAISAHESEAALTVAEGAVVLDRAASAAAETILRILDEDETYLADGAKLADMEGPREMAASAHDSEAAVSVAGGAVMLDKAASAAAGTLSQTLREDETYLAVQGAEPADTEDSREMAASAHEHEAAVSVADGAAVLEPAANAVAGTILRILGEDETYLAAQEEGAKPADIEDRQPKVEQTLVLNGPRETAVSANENEAAVSVADGAAVLQPAGNAAPGTLSRTLDEGEAYLSAQEEGARPADMEDIREMAALVQENVGTILRILGEDETYLAAQEEGSKPADTEDSREMAALAHENEAAVTVLEGAASADLGTLSRIQEEDERFLAANAKAVQPEALNSPRREMVVSAHENEAAVAVAEGAVSAAAGTMSRIQDEEETYLASQAEAVQPLVLNAQSAAGNVEGRSEEGKSMPTLPPSKDAKMYSIQTVVQEGMALDS